MELAQTEIAGEHYKGAITFTVEGATKFNCPNLARWLSDKFQCAFIVVPWSGQPGWNVYRITAPHYIDPTGITWNLTALEEEIVHAQKFAHLLELVEEEDDQT